MKTQFRRGKVEVMEKSIDLSGRKRHYKKKPIDPHWVSLACRTGKHGNCYSRKCQCQFCKEGTR